MPLFSSKASEAGYDRYSNSEYDQPPAYKQAVGHWEGSHHSSSRHSSAPRPTNRFSPTNQLQVQAIGYDTSQAWTGNTLENIEVYSTTSGNLKYVSIRLKKNSNSCALVRGSDPRRTPLISTIYRFGPGRPPRMRLLPPNTTDTVESAIENDGVRGELIEVKSRSMVSKAQKFETSLGTFEWRYGEADERRECAADNLLILERTDRVSSSAGGLRSKRGVRVAQLIRNDQYRTPGTKRYMGGNGGRLQMDLSLWGREQQEVEAFMVSSVICMLKREADRFKDNQLALVV